MNRSWIVLLALAVAAPAFAQDEPAAEAAPAEEAPAEETPTEEAPAEEAVSEASGEAAPAEEGASEPWKFYIGADTVDTTLSQSAPPSAAASDAESSMLRVRVGARVLEAISLELHYGVDQADEDAGEVTTDAYYGVYFVPTAKLYDWLELAFPVGYGRSEFDDSGEALGSIAYGVDLEIPIKGLWDALPDIRLTGGGMVYYQKGDGRVYGINSGLRYDF